MGLGMLIFSTSSRYVELIRQMQWIFESERKYTLQFMKSQQQRIVLFSRQGAKSQRKIIIRKWIQIIAYRLAVYRSEKGK